MKKYVDGMISQINLNFNQTNSFLQFNYNRGSKIIFIFIGCQIFFLCMWERVAS